SSPQVHPLLPPRLSPMDFVSHAGNPIMSNRSIFLTIAAVFVLGSIASVTYVLLRHEADWYANASVPPGPEREKKSSEFVNEVNGLIQFVAPPPNDQTLLTPNADKPSCWGQFSDEQINSFFEEGLISLGLESHLLPDGVRQPRVAIEPGR